MLLLRAEEADDVPILSACVQDMALKISDVQWLPRQKRVVLLGNRFRWEKVKAGGRKEKPTRVRCALRFDFVEQAQRRYWPVNPEAVVSLLAITVENEDTVRLDFSGFTSLKLKVDCVDITLEDLSGPWAASSVPEHN